VADDPQPTQGSDVKGGHAGSHAVEDHFPLLVGPATEQQRNTLRFMLVPIACWRIDDVRFDFDSAFVLPSAKREFDELAQLRKKHDGAPISIFGHADPVGDDNYNKALSGRRAEAIYAVLIREPNRWEKIAGQESGTHQWGVKAVQIMLTALGEDPGPPTGTMNPQTKAAVKSFQSKKGLTPNGDPGPPTRKQLFIAYMDFLAGDLVLDKTADFLAQGADPQGKGDFQGCGEFNPSMVFSKEEDAEFKKPARKSERDEANSVNRRVVVLLFRPGSVVPAQKWPCPRANEGIGGCQKRFWSDSEVRRNPQAERREFLNTKDTFGCRFYHRMTVRSPCEGVGPITPTTLYLKLTFVDDHFAPKAETCTIKHTSLGFAAKTLTLEISSAQANGGAPFFVKELTPEERTDGEHTFEWDGKGNVDGDLKDKFVHPLLSPLKVRLFHDGTFTGELETKVLYHSIVLKNGPLTADEADPPKGSTEWVQFKLNKLGYVGGPVGKDTDGYLKKAVIRYKVNHKKFHKPIITDYDDSTPGDVIAALDANENDRKFPVLEAIEDPAKPSNVLVEEITYDRTSATTNEFGSTRPPHEKDRINRPLIPVEAEIFLKKKDDSKVLEPEGVGPCRINWSHKDPDEDLSPQFPETAAEPSKTKKFIEDVLKQEQGRTGTNGDNCPIKFGGVRDVPDDNWKTPFLAGDFYIPYTAQEDAGNKVVFSTASVDKDKFPKRLGRAGILLRPSYIGGDDYQFRAEISFQGLPNQKQLEQFHGMTNDVKTHIGADTGVLTIRRFAKVAVQIDWPKRKNSEEWDKVETEFKKSFLDVDVADIKTKKVSDVITVGEYRSLVTKNTDNKDAAKISLFDDALFGMALPAQGNDDADTYKLTLKTLTHDNYNNKIQRSLGRLFSEKIRKDHATGFIVCNFLLHKPVDVKNNPAKADNTVTPGNKGFITWGGSIGLPDSVILVDQKDPDKVYYVVAHEMGHNLYLLHYENTPDKHPTNHDLNDHNCTMSYSDPRFKDPGRFAFQAPGKYSPHFCGKCNLSVRGWDVTNPGVASKSSKGEISADEATLSVKVVTPLGANIDGVEVEVMNLGKRPTGTNGLADFGKVKPGTFDIKVRKHGFGPPPTGGNPWSPGENRVPALAVAGGSSGFAKIELVGPTSIVFSHTPDDAAHPERIFKVNNGDTSVDHIVRATVVLPQKPGSGAGTQYPLTVTWTVEMDAANCPLAKGGKDATSTLFVSAPGFPAGGSMKTEATTITNDAGVTEIKLSASAIAGDKFRVTATIVDPFNPGKNFGRAQSPWFEVWKRLNYKGLYRMVTGADTGTDVAALSAVGNIQPAYTPGFCEYIQGAVTNVAYQEYISPLLPPTVAQVPLHAAVSVTSDGPDTRAVMVEGLIVAADLSTSVGRETVTLAGTSAVSTAAKFQQVTRVSAPTDPARTITVREVGGAARTIATIGAGTAAAAPNFLFDTLANVNTNAQKWADADRRHMNADVAAYTPAAGIVGYHIVGCAYLHPKHDKRPSTGRTTYYAGYPSASIQQDTLPFHPDAKWSAIPGINNGQKSLIFLNAGTGAYATLVCRHEIGHASDHVSFGGGDHCPQTTCLMYFAAQANTFCTHATDHSLNRLKGRQP
jgi:hypothetical protein